MRAAENIGNNKRDAANAKLIAKIEAAAQAVLDARAKLKRRSNDGGCRYVGVFVNVQL